MIDEPVDVVEEYEYLGSIVMSDCGLGTEINAWIGKAFSSLRSMSKVLWYQQKIKVRAKMKNLFFWPNRWSGYIIFWCVAQSCILVVPASEREIFKQRNTHIAKSQSQWWKQLSIFWVARNNSAWQQWKQCCRKEAKMVRACTHVAS